MAQWRVERAWEDAHPPSWTTTNGGVYFVRCETFIKIGIANDVRARLRGLACSSPFTLEPLGFIPIDAAIADEFEASLHKQFADARQRGEWFRVHDALLTFIAEHAKPWPELDIA